MPVIYSMKWKAIKSIDDLPNVGKLCWITILHNNKRIVRTGTLMMRDEDDRGYQWFDDYMNELHDFGGCDSISSQHYQSDLRKNEYEIIAWKYKEDTPIIYEGDFVTNLMFDNKQSKNHFYRKQKLKRICQ